MAAVAAFLYPLIRNSKNQFCQPSRQVFLIIIQLQLGHDTWWDVLSHMFLQVIDLFGEIEIDVWGGRHWNSWEKYVPDLLPLLRFALCWVGSGPQSAQLLVRHAAGEIIPGPFPNDLAWGFLARMFVQRTMVLKCLVTTRALNQGRVFSGKMLLDVAELGKICMGTR